MSEQVGNQNVGFLMTRLNYTVVSVLVTYRLCANDPNSTAWMLIHCHWICLRIHIWVTHENLLFETDLSGPLSFDFFSLPLKELV